MSVSPVVSCVVTVYNKARYLPDTIRSIRHQMDDEHEVEYVFVDDASSDCSVTVIRELLDGAPNVQIIENDKNRGPSVRLNQGARAAQGTYLHFLDSDDIASQGAILGMLKLLRKEKADFIYGKTWKRADPSDLFSVVVDSNAPYIVSDHPLKRVLAGKFVRMALMCKRDLFLEAGGADERIFVQDESLPLRLASKASRMIDWQADVVLQPSPIIDTDKVSSRKAQLHHDAFLAFSNALTELEDCHQDLAPLLYARAVSNYWKHVRTLPGNFLLHPGFWRYLQTEFLNPAPDLNVLAWMADDFAALPGVRRM